VDEQDRHRRGRALAAALRWRPEWPIAAVVTVAWLAQFAGVGMAQMNMGPAQMGGDMGKVGLGLWCGPIGSQFVSLSSWTSRFSVGLGQRYSPTAAIGQLPGWSLMVVAMMVPATLPAVRHVGLNSMRYRRRRAMAFYVAAYVALWAAFGLVALELGDLLTGTVGVSSRVLLALAVAVAAGWQLTRAKRRALLACGRAVPLYPTGWRADVSCARFGCLQARRCVVSCWAIMLVMVAATTATLVWMAALTAFIAAEDLTRSGRHARRPTAAGLALVALVVAVGV